MRVGGSEECNKAIWLPFR